MEPVRCALCAVTANSGKCGYYCGYRRQKEREREFAEGWRGKGLDASHIGEAMANYSGALRPKAICFSFGSNNEDARSRPLSLSFVALSLNLYPYIIVLFANPSLYGIQCGEDSIEDGGGGNKQYSHPCSPSSIRFEKVTIGQAARGREGHSETNNSSVSRWLG